MELNPHELAIAELKKMPSLANRKPRNIFRYSLVVMADLKPRKTTITASTGICAGLFLDALKK